jgi:hypothetical protein
MKSAAAVLPSIFVGHVTDENTGISVSSIFIG